MGAATLAACLAVPLAGCSGDDEKKPAGDGETSTAAEPQVRTLTTVGAVAGRLPKPARSQVASRVARVIDTWWDGAYLGGEWPRADVSQGYSVFTAGAARDARRERDLTSNGGLGPRLTGVEAVTRRVTVDLVAYGQRPLGATARVTLLMQLDGDDLDRRDRVSGRVLLTISDGQWRVFGYDLRRETVK